MCKLFEEWKDEIKAYMLKNNLNFEATKKLSQGWNSNTLALSFCDSSLGSNGLLNDTPSPLVLLIRREKDGHLVFEQTEHTQKYLGINS